MRVEGARAQARQEEFKVGFHTQLIGKSGDSDSLAGARLHS